jgi:hypothetical protein
VTEISAKEIAEVTELFAKEPLEIADSPEKRAKIVAYMRKVRENIAELEKAGKTITKKSKDKGVERKIDPNVDPLDLLAGV